MCLKQAVSISVNKNSTSCLPFKWWMITYLYVYFKDMSYLCCIEIKGLEEEIIAQMKRLMSEDTGKHTCEISCFNIVNCFEKVQKNLSGWDG